MYNLFFKKLVAALLAVTVISFPFVTTGCSRTQEDDAVSSTETEAETTVVETSATVVETEAVVETDATLETEATINDHQEISREPLELPDGKYIGTIYSVSEDGKSMLVRLEEPITMSVEEARTYEVGDEIILPLRDGEMTCTVVGVEEYDYPQIELDAYGFSYFIYNPYYDCMVLYDGNWIVGSDVSYEGVITTTGDYMLYDYLSKSYSYSGKENTINVGQTYLSETNYPNIMMQIRVKETTIIPKNVYDYKVPYEVLSCYRVVNNENKYLYKDGAYTEYFYTEFLNGTQGHLLDLLLKTKTLFVK